MNIYVETVGLNDPVQSEKQQDRRKQIKSAVFSDRYTQNTVVPKQISSPYLMALK